MAVTFRDRFAFLALCCLAIISVGTLAAAEPHNPADSNDDLQPMERLVSYSARQVPLKTALEELCRQAGLSFRWDTEGLAAVNLKPDQPVDAALTDEPLISAMMQLFDWSQYRGLINQQQGSVLVLTTIDALVSRNQRHTPAWLAGKQGLIVSVDVDGEVVGVHGHGDFMTDEFLARLKTLPKLWGLTLISAGKLTEEGIAALAELKALEHLELFETPELGNRALRALRGHKSLEKLKLSECGTTDADMALLRELPRLRSLTIILEGRLTDASIAVIAGLKELRTLILVSNVASTRYGKMEFSQSALRQLFRLRKLETLIIPGDLFPVEGLPLPRLLTLELQGPDVTDADMRRVAECRNLRTLYLTQTRIGNEGLKSLGSLQQLRKLQLSGGYVTHAGLRHLQSLPRLSELSIFGDPLPDAILAPLSQIKPLSRLSVVIQEVNREELLRLKDLPRLRALTLIGASDKNGFIDLADFQQLQELDLRGCTINAQQYHALEAALPHTRIEASNGSDFLPSSRGR